jgi:N-acyl-D-aspartate/D-glutamate deacylase
MSGSTAKRLGGAALTLALAWDCGVSYAAEPYDRGAIRTDLKADVTIFSAARIDDVASHENPTAYPKGIDHVLVNGTVAVHGGRHAGARPGQVLTGGGCRPVGGKPY